MKRHPRFFALGRPKVDADPPVSGKQGQQASAAPTAAVEAPPAGTDTTPSGSSLEQAYRDLLLEYQLMAETNQLLHQRLARRAQGLEESPAARELIHAQRNALVERSRRMRELEFENGQLKLERRKLQEDNRRLATALSRQLQEAKAPRHREEALQRELAEIKAALREKNNELLRLTDRYYQLEAKTRPQRPAASAANGEF